MGQTDAERQKLTGHKEFVEDALLRRYIYVSIRLHRADLYGDVYAELLGGYILSIEADSQKVGIYEKVEFLIHLDTKYGNPFDPDEVDLSIELRTPTGREITIPAFYYQHYEERHMDKGNRATDWLYPVGEPCWKARFAPSEEGIYLCTATLGAFS